MEEKANGKAWIDDFEEFFVDNGYHLTQTRYGLETGIMKYYLYRLGFHAWHDKDAHVKCYYNNKGDMVWRGHVTERIKNKFYDYRLEQISEEQTAKILWGEAYAQTV